MLIIEFIMSDHTTSFQEPVCSALQTPLISTKEEARSDSYCFRGSDRATLNFYNAKGRGNLKGESRRGAMVGAMGQKFSLRSIKVFVKILVIGLYLSSLASICAGGLKIESDEQALQYCQLNSNTYIALLYPCKTWDAAWTKSIFDKYGSILYQKKITLVDNGPINILHIAYDGEPWIGGFHDGFHVLKSSLRRRFPGITPDRFYEVGVLLVECTSLKKVIACKKEIRRNLSKGHRHPIHINDTHQETITMAQAVFHSKSIDFLNSSRRMNFTRFDQLLTKYKKMIAESGAASEKFCIVGSAVHAAMGLQDCKDLCFIHQGDDRLLKKLRLDSATSNVSQTPRYRDSTMRDEIIYNPANHFYYKNVKFAFR